ncbi:CPBP family intramembrane glutamic endopeptidase [Bacillus sp. CDB3]|uniref:CPBP family intramembrane glutamic endopeptidase n=1 Tax=Bacillus sp. CDB3 TaxID=360310 RepID=UPI0009D89379|nr:CPBP family intramembrane glutamic endopeptidase [Bacillus sp. CDB3]OQR54834.1 CPBP family intramembrane metalloprotease [Bacillus sp. CDB3]
MEKFYKKYPTAALISFFIVIIILMAVSDTLFTFLFLDSHESDILSRSTLLLVLLLSNTAIFKIKFGDITNRIGLGLLLSIPILIVVVSNAQGIEPNNLMKVNMHTYLLAVISTIASVTFEEILMRGILLNGFIKVWNHKTNAIWLSVIWSSLIFSLTHLANLSSGQKLNVTMIQLVFTVGLGFFCAAIYIRTNNLLIPIIAHFLVNIAAQLNELDLSLTKIANESTKDGDILWQFIYMGGISLVLILFSWIYLRKKKFVKVLNRD